MKYGREEILRAINDFLAVSSEHGTTPDEYFKAIDLDYDLLYLLSADMADASLNQGVFKDIDLTNQDKEELSAFIVANSILWLAIGHRLQGD